MPLFGFFLHRSYSNDQADAILLREDVIGEVVYEPAASTIDSMKPASWNLWVDGGFLVLRLAKRGAASWQDGGE